MAPASLDWSALAAEAHSESSRLEPEAAPPGLRAAQPGLRAAQPVGPAQPVGAEQLLRESQFGAQPERAVGSAELLAWELPE